MRSVGTRGARGVCIYDAADTQDARVSLCTRHGRAAFGASTALLTAFVLLLLVLPCIARAVDLDVLVGFGQSTTSGARYRPDTWTPLTVYLTGQGVRGAAQLQVSVRIGGHETIYTRRVALTDGPINQAESFAIQLHNPDSYGFYSSGMAPEIDVRLLLDGRSLAGPKKVSLPGPIAPETFNVLALTRDGSGLNFLTRKKLGLIHRHFNPANIGGAMYNGGGEAYRNGINPNATLQALYTDPRALPSMPQGYAAIDAIALGDQPLDNLTDDQLDAIKAYARQGGLLVISGGADVARLAAGTSPESRLFRELLPITPTSAIQVQALPDLEKRYATPLPLAGGTTLAQGTLKPNTMVLFSDRAGRPLITARPYGAGVVVFTAFDFLDRSLRAWPAGPALWRDLLRGGNESVSPRDVLASARDNPQGSEMRMADALAGARAASAPPLMMLILFCGAYLLLLVPVNYVVLKKIDRREMTWITAPVLIASFTVASYLFARSIKGGALTVNRAVVLETHANSDQAAGYAQMTLYSPRRATYDISPGSPDDPNNPYRLLYPSEVFTNAGQSVGADLTIDNDQTGTTLRNTLIRLWDKRSFDTPVAASLGGSVDATTTALPDHRRVQVTVTNHTRYTLDHCALISEGDSVSIGTLSPGQSMTQTMMWSIRKSAFNLPITYDQAPIEAHPSRADTPEATQARIAHALAQTLSSGTDQSQNYMYNGMGERGYGQVANAFVGWFTDPLLDVRVDGQTQMGQEVNVLVVDLPMPEGASARAREETNPFSTPAIVDLEEETKPGPQGVLR